MTTTPRQGETLIDNTTLADLLLCSFRYSLGRATYITGDCAKWLERYWSIIPLPWQQQIHDDIKKAISAKKAGHQCDIETWHLVLALPVGEA